LGGVDGGAATGKKEEELAEELLELLDELEEITELDADGEDRKGEVLGSGQDDIGMKPSGQHVCALQYVGDHKPGGLLSRLHNTVFDSPPRVGWGVASSLLRHVCQTFSYRPQIQFFTYSNWVITLQTRKQWFQVRKSEKYVCISPN
jgi:hypothetical protein